MKKYNIKIINFLFIFLVGFLLAIGYNTTTSSASLSSNETGGLVLNALVDHGPINVEYDANFTDYGFPGTGSPADPYRIENLNITVASDYPILFGGNNTKHFVIQNCFLKTDTNHGIYLGKYNGMGDGTVKILNNDIISENRRGIVLYGGVNSLISGNTITSYDDGIAIYEFANFSTVSYNIISSVEESGIYAEQSSSISITRNTCVGNRISIYLNNIVDSIVNHNNCSESVEEGIVLSITNNITIINNILSNNDNNGIDATQCDNSVFTNNLFQENDGYAIEMRLNSDNNIVHHNAFIDNKLGGVQALDDGANNIWFDTIALEGNFWSDWVSGSYALDGISSAVDPYPLNYVPVVPEFSTLSLAIILFASILAIPVVNLNYKKK